ncbi:MAG: hypothetical protein C4319_09080, partial [Acidimicrobiia bacterium]
EYILSTFAVFARKRPEFYAYLQARVQEWKQKVEGAKVYTTRKLGELGTEYGGAGEPGISPHRSPESNKGD